MNEEQITGALEIQLLSFEISMVIWASQVVLVIKNPPANAGDMKTCLL